MTEILNDFDGDPGSLFEMGLISQDEAVLLSTTNVPNPEREALRERILGDAEIMRLARLDAQLRQERHTSIDLGTILVDPESFTEKLS